MDPEKAIEELLKVIHHEEEQARIIAKDLREWIAKGGFTPRLTEPQAKLILREFLNLIPEPSNTLSGQETE